MELRSELQPYLVTTEVGPMLQHPLIHQLFFGTQMEIEWANQAYEQKTAAIEAAIEAGEWDQVVAFHERPYRVDVLTRIPRDTRNYWSIVAAWWADTEFPSLRLDTWDDILDDPEAHKMMGEMDRAVYDALPDHVVVYRGFGVDGEGDGLSWTLSEEKARWFAARFSTNGSRGTVVERTVAKSAITAYLDRRNEQEVIVLPHCW